MTKRSVISSAIMITAACAGITFAGIALAAPKTYQLPEETTEFRPGPGSDVAQNNCMACHSVDYIAFQPPRKGRAFWEAEVLKMIHVYGAPIDEADAKTIIDYLATTY